jgi:hypothetical protein
MGRTLSQTLEDQKRRAGNLMMPDEGSENGSGFDISKLKAIDGSYTSKAAEISKRFDEANPNLKVMRDALDTSGLSAAAKAAQNISTQLDPLRGALHQSTFL